MKETVEERLARLEAKVNGQSAEIEALLTAVSDLSAAHTVLHGDLRLCSFLKEYRDGDLKMATVGGTERMPSSHFSSRGNLFAKLLEEVANSRVFDEYWHQRFFWRREERERRALMRIRDAVQAKVDG